MSEILRFPAIEFICYLRVLIQYDRQASFFLWQGGDWVGLGGRGVEGGGKAIRKAEEGLGVWGGDEKGLGQRERWRGD